MIYLSDIQKYLKVVESRSVGLVNSSHHPLTVEWPPASRARIRSTDRWPFSHVPINLTNFIHSWNHIPFLSPSTLLSFFQCFNWFCHNLAFLSPSSHLSGSFLTSQMSPLARFDRDVYSRFNATHRCSHEFDNDMSLYWWCDEVKTRMVMLIVTP